MRKLAPVIFFAACALIIVQACKSAYPVEKKAAAVNTEPDLENGKKLTVVICGVCHLDQGSNKLTGAKMHEIPNMLGEVYAANITRDSAKGIGQYTEAELRYLIRTGVKRDGHMSPFMIRPNLSDKDLEDILAFLRSDDPMVAPEDIAIGESKYSPIGKLAFGTVKPFPYPAAEVKGPGTEDTITYGKYLVDNLACFHCHSASMAGSDLVHIEQTDGYMAGGAKLYSIDGSAVRGPNLTMDQESGIGKWSLEDFSKTLKYGVSPEKKILRYPMKMYPELTDGDIEAMFLYLKTLKPVLNKKFVHK